MKSLRRIFWNNRMKKEDEVNNSQAGGFETTAPQNSNAAGSQDAPENGEAVQPQKPEEENAGMTHVYNLIIVDESGSMSHLREATLSGINETIGVIRSAQEQYAQTQQHFLTLVTFDENPGRPSVRTIFRNCPIGEVEQFADYEPCGCTPLYDAMGQSLTELYNQIKGDADASAVVTILTDGLENASREWDAQALRQLIEKLKGEGWSFSYMGSAHDVKEVTDLLAIENVVEFSHDVEGASNTWARERSSRMSHFRKLDAMYNECKHMTASEKVLRKTQFAREYYSPRVSPDVIRSLDENEIFVFGSNANGYHTGGAAAFALNNFGAIYGQGEGLQGSSYAIPTMEGVASMAAAIGRFTKFATEHPEMRFLVTRIGCGIAGYDAAEVAPFFRDCIGLENVALPSDFWDVLGLKMK